MNKDFIPYEKALELKELGFNEKCLAYYKDNELYQEAGVCYVNSDFGETLVWDEMLPNKNCTAPLYQQAFRWFREKHELTNWVYNSRIDRFYYAILYNFRIVKGNDFVKTYEEAELECLKKLIEIVKNK